MKFTLREIASHVDGDISGNPDLVITGISEIQNSIPGTISFLGNMQYKKYVSDTAASAIFVSDPGHLFGKNGIIVENPQLAIAKTLEMFHPEPKVKKSVRKGAFTALPQSQRLPRWCNRGTGNYSQWNRRRL